MFTFKIGDGIRHDVVENVIASFIRLLVGDARFFEQVNFHVGARQFAGLVEMDADEFALEWKRELS